MRMQPLGGLEQTLRGKESIGELLRFWRKANRVSQLDLALDIGISSRHLSFVETGRSRPSRDVLRKIVQALNLPLRHRNAFFKAAGYAPEYEESSFDGDRMATVRKALGRLIDKHDPYPAFVTNASYDILMANKSYTDFILSLVGEEVFRRYNNSLLLLFADDGIRRYVKNWSAIEAFMLARLYDEAVTTQNSALIDLYHKIAGKRVGESFSEGQESSHLPFLSLTLVKDSVKMSFFTTVTTLGTPLDLTAQEIRIELLFPADEKTRAFYH